MHQVSDGDAISSPGQGAERCSDDGWAMPRREGEATALGQRDSQSTLATPAIAPEARGGRRLQVLDGVSGIRAALLAANRT
jgi:hypothetical protein